MRISSKIILLAAALLIFLGVNSIILWGEINNISIEFDDVVKNDLKLMEYTTTLNDVQLRKEIIFEKLTGAAEELAFASINDSRRQYLLSYLGDLREQFQKDSLVAQKQIVNAFRISDSSQISFFKSIEKIVMRYDQKVEGIFKSVLGSGYQLSLEDLDQVETQEVELTKDLRSTLGQVWLKVNVSTDRIKLLQQRSQNILWATLTLSLAFALILASGIIRSIHTSLKLLVQGVKALQKGELGSQVNIHTTDEIGELAAAFNRMSQQLKEYQERMQKKNIELANSLALTNEQKKELEKINRDLDRFVHLISHDIYGPITAIISYADYLQKHKDTFDPKTQQVVANLRHVIDRLNAMVLDLVEMTKITRIQRPYEKVDLTSIVQEALNRQQFNIQKTSAVIHLPDRFPMVMGDQVKLTIVLFNLIGNAIKYSSKGLQSPQVDISWNKRPSDYLFCIKDNGIGIAPEHYQTIFHMFKRLPEAEGFEGSGVGLTIVKEIIQEHGGEIWIESTPGQGAQFFFTIPLESSHRLS
jgi:signal transduction histidine kinase